MWNEGQICDLDVYLFFTSTKTSWCLLSDGLGRSLMLVLSRREWRPYPHLLVFVCTEFCKSMLPRPRRLLLLVNPFSGRGQAMQWCQTHILPMIREANISYNLIQTGKNNTHTCCWLQMVLNKLKCSHQQWSESELLHWTNVMHVVLLLCRASESCTWANQRDFTTRMGWNNHCIWRWTLARGEYHNNIMWISCGCVTLCI